MGAILAWWRRDGGEAGGESWNRAWATLAGYGMETAVRQIGREVALGRRTREGVGALTVRDGWVVGADARIDGRGELGVALGERPETAEGWIAAALERWGEKAAERLYGDYAWVAWEEGRRRLVAGRDYAGVRPLYYHDGPTGLVLATDMRALLALPGIDQGLDDKQVLRLAVRQAGGMHDPERTLMKGIRKVPPGCVLIAEASGVRLERYWRPENLPRCDLPGVADYAERLRELVEQAVADRLPPGTRFGAHVSGGIDSSSVAVVAARLARARGEAVPPVYSWSPPPGDGVPTQEQRRIEAICGAEGLKPTYVDATPQELAEILTGEDPALRPMQTMQFERWVQRRAAEDGVQVLVSGWGGDEAVSFNGRGVLAAALAAGEWRVGWAVLRRQWAWRHPLALPRMLWAEGLRPHLGARYNRRQAVSKVVAKYVRPVWQALLTEVIREARKEGLWTRPGARANMQALYYDGFTAARIESWATYGADHGIDYVYPLLDRRVVEFVHGWPEALHRHGGVTRAVYRMTASAWLPAGTTRERLKMDPALLEAGRKMGAAKTADWEARWQAGAFDGNRWIDLKRLRLDNGGVVGGFSPELRRWLAIAGSGARAGRRSRAQNSIDQVGAKASSCEV